MDASDRKQVRKAEKAAARVAHEDDEYLLHVMSTSSGRAWIARRLTLAFQTPWSPDPHATSFNCGQQSPALELLANVIRVAPDQFILMQRESYARDTARELDRSQNDGRDDSGPVPEAGYDAAGADWSGGDTDAYPGAEAHH